MQSTLTLSTKLSSNGKTQLDHYFVTPPFKVLTLPNTKPNDLGLNAIQMSSSPGILAGDELNIHISLAKSTALSLRTQAFSRVQAMNMGEQAHQNTQIELAEDSKLFYLPHPLVLHTGSSFHQKTLIKMQPNSQLIYGEIVAIGRVLNDERFAFHHFSSYLRIEQDNRPLVSDRIQWLPSQMDLTALSQMEEFSHQGSLTFLHIGKSALEIKALVSELQTQYNTENKADNTLLIGISQLNESGLMVRILGHNADSIQKVFENIGEWILKIEN